MLNHNTATEDDDSTRMSTQEELLVFPMSFAQQRLWAISRLEPASAVYNVPVFLRLTGSLNVAALQESLTRVVQRHEVLRANFRLRQGKPVQVIRPAGVVTMPLEDLSRLSEAARETEAHRRAAEEIQRPFDLQRDPLVRASLLSLSNNDHVLLLTTHHIVSDGWSIGLLVDELAIVYDNLTAGNVACLPELPIQYTDYAVWQREYMQGPVLEEQLRHWRERLKGASTGTELPSDRTRPAVQTSHGASKSLLVAKPVAVALQELSRREGATVFMTLLAAFKVLLARYTGQDDIIVGSPVAGRTRTETEKLIGFFLNTLILRTDLSGNPSFRELLRRVKEVAMGAYAHQDLPFEKLVEELNPERHASHNPFFQIMFTLQNVPQGTRRFSGLTAESFASINVSAKFDLLVRITEVTEGLRLNFTYNTDLFDEPTIDRLLSHYQNLLRAVIAGPDKHLADLSFLSDAERRCLLSEWNATQTEYPRDVCIPQLFEAQVERTPTAKAVTFDNQSLTYAELNARANQLARHLKKIGIGPEVLVGIYVERSLEMLVGLLGILKAGSAYVPLDPTYPKDRLQFIVHDAQIKFLLTQESLASDAPGAGMNLVCLDKDWPKISREPQTNLTPQAHPHNLAYVLYTSGSTGKPKGVQIEHRNVVNFLCTMQERPGINQGDVLLAVTTLSFDIAGLELYLPLTVGAQLVIASRRVAMDGSLLGATIANSGATVVQATPATWRLLLDAGWQGRPHLKILCGGEALSRELADQLLSRCASLWNMYGPTETTIWSSVYKVRSSGGALVPIGRPIGNTQMYLLDKQNVPVPVGAVGELYIGGDGVARGYFNRPELTKERFVPDPFSQESGARLYKTGDLARFLPDGNIEFLGRVDDQVKIRGYRIELGEIEAVLRSHPDIHQVVAAARDSVTGDKRLVAYVVPAFGSLPQFDRLRSYLHDQLPDYMLPSAFVVLDKLPLTPNGKVDRRALPEPQELQHDVNTFVAPRTPLEEQFVQIWERLLDVRPVGVTDNFFHIGGHSLLAIRMLDEVERTIGKKISLATLFSGATIEYLAQIAEGKKEEPARTAAVQIQSGAANSATPPFFSIIGPDANALGYAKLAQYLGPDLPLYKLESLDQPRRDEPYPPEDLQARATKLVEAMRAVQPEGPYYFGGMCLGGHIAFEMARILQSQRQKVGVLAIFDTWVNENTSKKFYWYLDYLRTRVRRFRRLSFPGKLRDLGHHAHSLANLLLFHGSPSVSVAWRNAYWPGCTFAPPKYAGHITLFRTAKQPFYRINDPYLGWGERALDGVDIHLLPGPRRLMHREPYIQILADKLKLSIRKAQLAERGSSHSPLVSIVIPSYKAARYIRQALISVFAQTFADYEVIVVNDGSPDTEEFESALEPFLSRIRYIKQPNRGPSSARNSALRQARGKYIAFLDSDDVWFPHHLSEQMRRFAEDPSLDLVYADSYQLDENFRNCTKFMTESPQSGPVTFEALVREDCTIGTSSTVVRRDILLEVGLFDESTIRCEDLDLWLRLAHRGTRIAYSRRVDLCHRLLGDSLSANRALMLQAQLGVTERIAKTLPLSVDQGKLLRTRIMECEAELQVEFAKRLFHAGRYSEALAALHRADSYYHSLRLQAGMASIRLLPGTFRVLHRTYEQLLLLLRRRRRPPQMVKQFLSRLHTDYPALSASSERDLTRMTCEVASLIAVGLDDEANLQTTGNSLTR